MPLTKSDGTTFEYQHHYPAKKIDPTYAERFRACCVKTDEEAFEILENFRGKAFAWDTETIGLEEIGQVGKVVEELENITLIKGSFQQFVASGKSISGVNVALDKLTGTGNCLL